jgi:hypothetical protein
MAKSLGSKGRRRSDMLTDKNGQCALESYMLAHRLVARVAIFERSSGLQMVGQNDKAMYVPAVGLSIDGFAILTGIFIPNN